jgi:hypothetical protein
MRKLVPSGVWILTFLRTCFLLVLQWFSEVECQVGRSYWVFCHYNRWFLRGNSKSATLELHPKEKIITNSLNTLAASSHIYSIQVVVGCYKGKIYFLDMSTGKLSWTFQTDGEVLWPGKPGFFQRISLIYVHIGLLKWL